MATPAAILSILVDANSTEATAKLSKFDKQLAAVNDTAKRGVTAKLGGTFNPEAFNAYQERVARAARVAKDRAAFKAELGANFNASAFNSYERSIDKTNRATKTLEDHNHGLAHSFRGLMGGIAAAGGAFAGYEVAKSAIGSTIELAHNTERLSAVTGLDAKQASKWIEIMKVRGVSARQTGMLFVTLSKQVKTAQDGDKSHAAAIAALVTKQQAQVAQYKAAGASQKALIALEAKQALALAAITSKGDKATATFKELGVSQKLLKTGDTEKILKAAADGLSKIHDPARRAAEAQQLFGRGAQALLPILAQGSKGVDDALAAAQRYGAYLPANVRQLQAAHEAQMNLNLAMDGLKISFTQAVLPVLVQGAQKLMAFIAQIRSGKGAGGEFAKTVGGAFKTAKGDVQDVISAVGGIKPALEIAAGAFVATKFVKFFNFARDLTGAARSLGSVPGKLAALGKSKGAIGTVEHVLTGKGLSATVATMEVGTLIAKSTVSGSGVGGSGLSSAEKTAAKDAQKVSRFQRVASGAGKIARAVPFLGTAIALSDAAGVSPGDVARYASSGFHPSLGQNIGGDTSLVRPVTSVYGKLPPQNTAVLRGVPNLGRSAALSGAASQGPRLEGLALDAGKARFAMQSLGSDSAKAFDVIGRMAKQANDLRFSFADRVASNMLKAKGVNRGVVTDMLSTLAKLPPGAQTQAANTAIGMAAQLEAKGALPKGSAERIRQAITGSFTQMRVDTVGQAQKMATDVAKPLSRLERSVKTTASHISMAASSIVSSLSGILGKASAPTAPKHGGHFARGGMVTKPGYFAGEDAPQHPEVIIASNPAYRERNVKLWQRAGKMLGIPGYATGGVTPASQSTGAQTREATLANLLQTAQNGGNTVAQQRALNRQVGLERSLLSADREQLAKIIRELGGQLKAARRAQLQQDKLSVLQAMGGVLSNLGTASSSLASLSTATAAGPGSFDLAPTGAAVKLPTVFDVRHAIGHGGGGRIHKGANPTHETHVGGVTIYISENVDVGPAVDKLDRVINGNLRAHIRRAGMRGT